MLPRAAGRVLEELAANVEIVGSRRDFCARLTLPGAMKKKGPACSYPATAATCPLYIRHLSHQLSPLAIKLAATPQSLHSL
jgi:hypothetical protein